MITNANLLLDDFVGVDPTTGATIRGEAHLRACLNAILSTLIGSLVMDRDFGAKTRQRMDAPTNADTLADIVADTAVAVRRWEPRVILRRVIVRGADIGSLTVDLVVAVGGRTIILEGVV
ncbi:GPW/gp25 family protein [Brevundimonas faecalis]|uniref:GPW/gp25 family protein n=1 Tax=Brevundimonas faecalis TaxID=947378 RepID=UPI00360DADB0